MGPNNGEVAAVLAEIGLLLELKGENPFKARSYAAVAHTIGQLEEDVSALAVAGRLREIQGVGKALEQKIGELVATGELAYYDELRSGFPETLFELFKIPGLAAKRVKVLFEELGVRSLGELEYACTENRLAALRGFGAKSQGKILEGIAFAKRHRDLHLFDEALEEAELLVRHLGGEPSLMRIEVAGSLRRRKEVVKDIDIVASSEESAGLMARFVSAESIESVTARGETKTNVMLGSGIAADLRVVSDAAFPYALHHFTGSKEHNVALRRRARGLGLKMNEYGLFRGDESLACKDEAEIFAQLGLPYIPPELREDRGELDVEDLPALVTTDDLVGVYHCHTRYSDGAATVSEMAEATRARGYAYLAIADHSRSAGYAGGLSADEVARQHREIDDVNAALAPFRVLKGIESDIRVDGALDYDDDVLETFDLVIASVHTKLSMTEDEATSRLIRAIENPYTTVLGHPTGRLLLARPGYPVDMAKVIDACRGSGVAIEINANCQRLDLDWRHIRLAKDKGVKLCIGPDAHSVAGLDDVAYGVGIARKGWVEPRDLLNCMTVEEFLAWRGSS